MVQGSPYVCTMQLAKYSARTCQRTTTYSYIRYLSTRYFLSIIEDRLYSITWIITSSTFPIPRYQLNYLPFMKQYHRLLLAWLVVLSCCQQLLVTSFSLPKDDGYCGSRVTAHHHHIVENNQEIELDRRRFLVTSIIGAASVLAVSENAYAATDDKPSILVASAVAEDVPAIDTKAIFNKAAKKALGGGKAGAAAAVVQVLSLMWLRTAMNYQYRYGGTLGEAQYSNSMCYGSIFSQAFKSVECSTTIC